ncbi:YqiA/YcfP family alpha/beta fold hydrolase, partial [Metabacillus litoralis]|uniref:YqiA/YcfP family alpha/beta fold hydrolase n=2 Tax=Bacteria TaxID=2 RepID=UPI00204036E7
LVANRPEQSLNPQNLLVILKKGDELLNFQDAVNYFSQSALEKSNAQSHIIVEEGGDHVMSDFETKLPQIVQFLFGLPLI